MKIALLFLTLLFVQTGFKAPMYFNQMDFSDDGKIMAAIGSEYVILLNTETQKVLDKYALNEWNSSNENIRISGDGQHLIWAANRKFFYAAIHRNKIKKPTKLFGSVWLDIEINYDGTEFLATADTHGGSTMGCAPTKRQLVKYWRDGNKFEHNILMPDMKECQFMSYGELLPNGGIIYQFSDYYKKKQSEVNLFEAIPDGQKDWGTVKILEPKDKLAHQAMTESGDFMTYSIEKEVFCGLFINHKNDKGEWTQSENILPNDKNCQGPWFGAISPDGTKVAWLKLTRDEQGQPIKGDIMITHLVNGNWSTPAILVPDYGLASQGKQIKSLRISNTNLAFSLWSGQTYLCTRLDGDGILYSIK